MPAKREHRCPGGGWTVESRCTNFVPDRLLACPHHWFMLPSTVRQDIERTAKLPSLHPDRRIALSAAHAAWRGTGATQAPVTPDQEGTAK